MAVTEQIGLSPRYFNQLFRDYVGLTPKLFCRVRRFQQVLRLVEGKQQIDWLDVAFGLWLTFDQAHLIHDFRTFADWHTNQLFSKARGSSVSRRAVGLRSVFFTIRQALCCAIINGVHGTRSQPGETFMDSIAIVYFSATGHTHLMAEAIAAGVHRHGDTPR